VRQTTGTRRTRFALTRKASGEGENPFLPFPRDQGTRVLVAEYGGMPVGLGATEHGDNNISDIWISPLHEGKGAGSALIKALEQVIRDRSYGDASIQVAAANKRRCAVVRGRDYGSMGSDPRDSGNSACVGTCSRSDAHEGCSEANILTRSTTLAGSLRDPAGTIIFVPLPFAQGTPDPQTRQNDLEISRPGTW
jgi:GNAT superfamily N-acetyltransferase